MLTRRNLISLLPTAAALGAEDKTVVLTFDDAVKSHLTVVAPLLKELGFNATFFITHNWMNDAEHFLTWKDVAELHKMGFEIGNHSWTHAGFSTPKAAARLEAELALVDRELKKVAVPKPESFAWCGNAFSPEALAELERLGYKYARRGMQPELPYGEIQVGPAYDPAKHDRLLIPTTGDAYPKWTVEHFEKVIAQSAPGRVVVLQFHGVPDVAHPWVHTPPEMFEKYMRLLKARGFCGIAMRDLQPVAQTLAADPMRKVRYPAPKDGKLALPYAQAHPIPMVTGREFRVAPFPGLEHPRVGFQEGAIAPRRGTKAMAFLPWDPDSFVIIDVPEVIFSGRRILHMSHTDQPSIWDERNMVIEDRDWIRNGEALESKWIMPDTLDYGARVTPAANNAIDLELWITNKSNETFTQLRLMSCILLKWAKGLNELTAANKELTKTYARVSDAGHSVTIEWENAGRTWGNPKIPCMHCDPLIPDCKPGETVRAHGKLTFA